MIKAIEDTAREMSEDGYAIRDIAAATGKEVATIRDMLRRLKLRTHSETASLVSINEGKFLQPLLRGGDRDDGVLTQQRAMEVVALRDAIVQIAAEHNLYVPFLVLSDNVTKHRAKYLHDDRPDLAKADSPL